MQKFSTNYQQKTSHRMGENICKLREQGIDLQKTKQFMQLNNKKPKQPNQKMGGRSKQTFLQRRHTNGKQTNKQKNKTKNKKNPTHEKMFNIINYQRNKIRTTMRYHLAPVRKAIIKKSVSDTLWRGQGKKETLLHCWQNVNWYRHFGEQYGGFLKI